MKSGISAGKGERHGISVKRLMTAENISVNAHIPMPPFRRAFMSFCLRGGTQITAAQRKDL
jgi:hypothetical protein